MRVAFVYPEVYDIARFGKKRKEFPPFGVLYLATIVSMQNGMDVRIFSVDSQIALDFSEFDTVAFSIPSSVTYDLMKFVCRKSKYAKDALLIAGGIHAQIFPQTTLQEMNIHAVSIGQGDETILDLLKRKDSRNFDGVAGVCYTDEAGEVVLTPSKPLKRSLDHLPAIPARDLLPDSDFILDNRLAGTRLRMTHIMLSQGCPFSCNFCAAQQRQMQYRSGLHVRQELKYLQDKYGIEGFAVVGDNFLVNKRKVAEVCLAIADLCLQWSTLSRVDMIDYDTLEVMRDAGCIEIKFGIESGSESILRAMGKRISVDQIYNAVHMTYAVGIGAKAFIIHGYPGENMETTRETIAMLDDLSGMIERVSLFRFVPLPGSFVCDNADAVGLVRIDNMNKCHIHHNPHHWWGSDSDFAEIEASYKELDAFIRNKWG